MPRIGSGIMPLVSSTHVLRSKLMRKMTNDVENMLKKNQHEENGNKIEKMTEETQNYSMKHRSLKFKNKKYTSK